MKKQTQEEIKKGCRGYSKFLDRTCGGRYGANEYEHHKGMRIWICDKCKYLKRGRLERLKDEEKWLLENHYEFHNTINVGWCPICDRINRVQEGIAKEKK